MALTIRRIAPTRKWADEVRELQVDALTSVISADAVRAAARTARRAGSRERKLSLEVTLWLLICAALYPHDALPSVLRTLTHGARLLWPTPPAAGRLVASASALVYRRAQLGVRPLVALVHQLCQPLASPAALPDAFAFGLRVVALDGTLETLPDTPANQRAFGRRASQRGRSVYPQALGVVLVECATHAIFAAGFWPATTSEHRVAPRLLRALTPEMLVLWDRGFHSVGLLRAVQAHGAQALGRLPAHVHPHLLARLPDGSALVQLQPGGARRRDPCARLVVRLVTYQIRAGIRAGHGARRATRYRLVTTLLEPAVAPAADLAALYHQRWAVEETFGELDTRLRLSVRTLRSQTPLGVRQELYGLLLAHYAVRALIYRAALQTQQAPTRLSFRASVRLVCEAAPDFQLLAPAQRPWRLALLLTEMAQARLPARSPRANPRAVKRRASKYPQKRPDQRGTPQLPGAYTACIHVLDAEVVI